MSVHAADFDSEAVAVAFEDWCQQHHPALYRALKRQGYAADGDADCYSVEEFCRRHRISVQLYYKLKQQGLAPVELLAGSRVLISKESAARWRRERERVSAA